MLVPGENQIEVSVILGDGRHVSTVRTVHYEPSEVESEEDRRDAIRMLIELRRRTHEIEAAGADRSDSDSSGDPAKVGPDEESP